MNHPILFSIGEFDFYTHGFMAVAGIMSATVLIWLLAGKDLERTYLFDNIVYTVLAGIIGARLTYVVLYSEQFGSITEAFFIWQGGLVSYGGFITGAITFAILVKQQKQPLLPWLDLLAIGFPLGLTIGRIGEYIAGENFGIRVSTNLSAPLEQAPIHLWEVYWCLLILIIVLVLYLKTNRRAKPGVYAILAIALYSAGRFVIDFWREENNLWLNISLGQTTSLAIFIVCAVLLVKLGRRTKRGNYEAITRVLDQTKKPLA